MATIRTKILSHFNGEMLTGVAFKDHARRKRIIAELSGIEEITINEIAESLNIRVSEPSARRATFPPAMRHPQDSVQVFP